MIINRVFARANAYTFEIPQVAELLSRYVGNGNGWVDPFAGKSILCEYRNDMNPAMNQPSCQEAEVFSNLLYNSRRDLNGVVFDPPYSYRQVSEHYKVLGMKASAMDTSANFTIRVKRAISPIIKVGGHAISFGWNTNGFGKCLGYEIVEILVIAHGLTHNDTLVTVEKKIANLG